MHGHDDGRWFSGPVADTGPAVKLLCLPHAGAGASTYRAWSAALEPPIQVIPIKLPGREDRIREPLARSTSQIVDALVGPVRRQIKGPFALFGHSMGALLAFELAHALADHGVEPVHLFASGHPAPSAHEPTGTVHRLPDGDLVRFVMGLDGTADEVLADRELLDHLVPVVRADFELCETYRYLPRGRLSTPITAIAGASDRDVPLAALTAWTQLTRGRSAVVRPPGGHFYLHNQLPEVVRIIRTSLGAGATVDAAVGSRAVGEPR